MEAVRTERMMLSRVTSADLDSVHEIHADPATNLYNPGGPVPDLESSKAMLGLWLDDWRERGLGYWAARRIGEQEVLGFGGLRRTRLGGEDVLTLYYCFRPSAWGQGYAVELVRAALRVGRPLGTVVAVIRDINTPSRRVAERAGMREDRAITYGGLPSHVYVG
uniref:GNAT family N-acetyltransferase n=1 Tax=Nonomuraea pusilla TaxID=46177 RepID=UPI0006E20A7A|nr:GNAT family N-acetyltransferase [Nonomuraea pusilla]